MIFVFIPFNLEDITGKTVVDRAGFGPVTYSPAMGLCDANAALIPG